MIAPSREEICELLRESLKNKYPDVLDFKVELFIRSVYSDDGFCLGDYDEIQIKYLTESPKRKIKKWETIYF